jgi:hypothetical protein
MRELDEVVIPLTVEVRCVRNGHGGWDVVHMGEALSDSDTPFNPAEDVNLSWGDARLGEPIEKASEALQAKLAEEPSKLPTLANVIPMLGEAMGLLRDTLGEVKKQRLQSTHPMTGALMDVTRIPLADLQPERKKFEGPDVTFAEGAGHD